MRPTTPAPHIPTHAHPLSTPKLPSNTGPTIPAPAFFADPITGMPTMLPTDDDEDSGVYIPTVDDNDETEAEWLDRRLGW